MVRALDLRLSPGHLGSGGGPTPAGTEVGSTGERAEHPPVTPGHCLYREHLLQSVHQSGMCGHKSGMRGLQAGNKSGARVPSLGWQQVKSVCVCA